MADQQSSEQNPNVTPFKGKTLIRSPKQHHDRPIAQNSSSAQHKRPAGSPLEGTSFKKQDSAEKDSFSENSDSDEDIENDEDKEQEEESQFELDETYGRNFEDVAEDVQLID